MAFKTNNTWSFKKIKFAIKFGLALALRVLKSVNFVYWSWNTAAIFIRLVCGTSTLFILRNWRRLPENFTSQSVWMNLGRNLFWPLRENRFSRKRQLFRKNLGQTVFLSRPEVINSSAKKIRIPQSCSTQRAEKSLIKKRCCGDKLCCLILANLLSQEH